MTDPGELFLQGYFGQAKLKQDQLNAAAQQQNFAQDLQQRAQDYDLQNRRLTAEIQQHAAEGQWRQATAKHQQLEDARADAQQDFEKMSRAFQLQSTGAGASVAPQDVRSTPGVSIGGGPLGLPGMTLPSGKYTTAQGGPAYNFGPGGMVRPTSPQERAQQQFTEQQTQEDIANEAKFTRAQENLNKLGAIAPDSEFITDPTMKTQVLSNMAWGTPIKDRDKWGDLKTKVTQNWLQDKYSGDPAKAAAADKKMHDFLQIDRSVSSAEHPGQGVDAAQRQGDLMWKAQDIAEVRERAGQLLAGKLNPTASDRSNATNEAARQISAERSRTKGARPLHPDATTVVASNEEKGIAVSPKVDTKPHWTTDPVTGKMTFVAPKAP